MWRCPYKNICYFWVSLYFSSCSLHILVILFELLGRWEVGYRTASVLWEIASLIFSSQHAAFLCCSLLDFPRCVLLACLWCIYIVVFTGLQFRRKKSRQSNRVQTETFPLSMANLYHIYQPLRSGRIWHKVNFFSGV